MAGGTAEGSTVRGSEWVTKAHKAMFSRRAVRFGALFAIGHVGLCIGSWVAWERIYHFWPWWTFRLHSCLGPWLGRLTYHCFLFTSCSVRLCGSSCLSFCFG